MQEKQAYLLPKLKMNVSTPEGVPRLLDLVRVRDEKMRLAFFAALGNTVVANNLDQVDFGLYCEINKWPLHGHNCISILEICEFRVALFMIPSLYPDC